MLAAWQGVSASGLVSQQKLPPPTQVWRAAVSLVTRPKPVSELGGLVWGVHDPNAPDPASVPKPVWWKSPKLLGGIALGIVLVLSIIFA